MSAWSEAAWVIRELTKKLEIEKNIEKLVEDVPITFVALRKEDDPDSPDIIDDIKIPRDSIWFVLEKRIEVEQNENDYPTI